MKLDRLRHGWDRAAVYLPVLTMGLLALGSYWVLRSAPGQPEPEPARLASHDPDYTMRGFSVRSHGIDGALRSELAGNEARHYPDNDMIEVDRAKLRAYGVQGRLTLASALRLSTDSKQSAYRLEGDVLIERSNQSAEGRPTRLMGEQLLVSEGGRYLTSDLPVEIVHGKHRATGDTLLYDDHTGIAELRGHVRVELARH